MKLTVCYRSSFKNTPLAVHASGCSDIERREKRLYGATTIAVEAKAGDVVAELALDADLRDMGYTADDVDVFPCCTAEVK